MVSWTAVKEAKAAKAAERVARSRKEEPAARAVREQAATRRRGKVSISSSKTATGTTGGDLAKNSKTLPLTWAPRQRP